MCDECIYSFVIRRASTLSSEIDVTRTIAIKGSNFSNADPPRERKNHRVPSSSGRSLEVIIDVEPFNGRRLGRGVVRERKNGPAVYEPRRIKSTYVTRIPAA
ncbi:hypothetical protein TSAR_000059 [Trichomalopsis sarcophagae]|uniref:Uncharacterized protein n=1 Tax=Trichomalopsis sarcophagae TaxID=543379 RepID=A0A232EZG5_9HYME|nr:hypothetical protein TSAR_000059 [Trichomalopsis sarcophagae]